MRDPIKIKKLKEVVKSLKKTEDKVIVLDSKPDIITLKDGKITAWKILKKIKGNRATKNFGADTYWCYSGNVRVTSLKEEYEKIMGFDKFDYEVVKEDRT